jgi:hypothetical protein
LQRLIHIENFTLVSSVAVLATTKNVNNRPGADVPSAASNLLLISIHQMTKSSHSINTSNLLLLSKQRHQLL